MIANLINIFAVFYLIVTCVLYASLVVDREEYWSEYGYKIWWKAGIVIPLWPILLILRTIFPNLKLK